MIIDERYCISIIIKSIIMKKKIYLLLTFTLVILQNSFSQATKDEILLLNESNIPSVFKLIETKVSADDTNIRNFIKQQFQLNEDFSFEEITSKTFQSITSRKIQQFYKGVKVEFGELVVRTKDNNVLSINSNIIPIKDINMNYEREDIILKKLLETINSKEYAWENAQMESALKQEQDPSATYFPKAELVIIDRDLNDSLIDPLLAYKFDVYSLNPLKRFNYYVDALNGNIILKDARIKHVEGLATTRYSGNRTIETELINNNFRTRDNTRGNGIETYIMGDGTNYGNANFLVDNDNSWTAQEYDNPNNDNVVLDAHWASMMTYDYFLEVHNRNSIDDDGFTLRNYVNADLTAFGFNSSDNAFWDGQRMTYGEGSNLNPLVSIDIVAHEIGHGLDEFTSDLIYQNESGAIDESLSDIWGAMVEFYAAPEKETYLLGEDVGNTFRSLSNPNQFGHPDTYRGEFWWTFAGDNGGVHTNSGVMNHWFFLLAEGGNGINDNDDSYNVSGIGKTKAANIIYHAQTNYFISTTNYAMARELTILAAEELYGSQSLESCNVQNAWYAVGLGDSCETIAGSDEICIGHQVTYSLIDSIPQGATITWQYPANRMYVISGQGTASITLNSFTAGTNNTISAIITLNNEQSISEKIIDIIQNENVSTPSIVISDYNPQYLTCCGQSYSFNHASSTSSFGNFEWDYTVYYQDPLDYYYFGDSGNHATIWTQKNTYSPLVVGVRTRRVPDQCGNPSDWSNTISRYYGVKSAKKTITQASKLRLNKEIPISEYFNIKDSKIYIEKVNLYEWLSAQYEKKNLYKDEVEHITSLLAQEENFNEVSIKIYNLKGYEILDMTTNKNKEEIDLSMLNKGVYIIQYQYGGFKDSKKIVITQ